MNRRRLLIGGGSVAALGIGAVFAGAKQMGSAADYTDAVRAMRSALSQHPQARDLIRYATLAPSGHNTQPWRFSVGAGRITIRPDAARRTPVVDPDDHHLFVSLGCAAETLAIAAAARGFQGEPRFDASGGGAIDFAYRAAPPAGSALFDAIPRRQSTRNIYDGRAVAPDDLATLRAAATMPGVDMLLITRREQIDRVRDLVLAGNSVQRNDAAFVRELKAWLRFNPHQALATSDGMYSAVVGSPALPDWLGPYAFDALDTVSSENDSYARQLQSSAGLAVFVGAGEDRAQWVQVGRACQRFALQATALGLKCAFVNQPVEVAALRPELAALLGMPGRRPDIVMRFGHGSNQPYSARRPVASVMTA